MDRLLFLIICFSIIFSKADAASMLTSNTKTPIGSACSNSGDTALTDNPTTKIIVCNGSTWQSAPSGGSASAAGSNGSLQYNDGGNISGDSSITWDNSAYNLFVDGTIETSGPLKTLDPNRGPVEGITQTFQAGALYIRVSNGLITYIGSTPPPTQPN